MSSNGESHSYLPSVQPQLFGSAVPRSDPAAELPKSPPSIEERREVIMRVYEKADRLMLERYAECLRFVGRAKSTFGAWDVTKVYEEKHGALDTHGKKALGGMFSHLLHSGLIEEAGFGKRPNGNIGPLYSLK